MGYASSNAVRRDDAYGSLGGSFGGTERKLKKKPVLVLDPDELAKAHQLFQIGAAEQLGEFDPKARAFRPAAALFSPILGAVPRYDQDDDYVAPLDLVAELASDVGEGDEETGDDLPPIDLDSLLALTRAEQDAEDAFYRDAAANLAALEADKALAPATVAEPEAETIIPEAVADEPAAIEPVAETYSPADALARIIERAAAQPKPAPETELTIAPPVAPKIALPEIAPEPEPMPEPEPEAELAAYKPEWIVTQPDDAATYSDENFDLLDLGPQHEFDDEPFVPVDAPVRASQIIGSEGTRSNLRARLVREDLPMTQPEPTMLSQMANALRRFWNSLPF